MVDIEYSESCLSIAVVGESNPISSVSVGDRGVVGLVTSPGESIPGDSRGLSGVVAAGRLAFFSLLRRSLAGRAPRLLERGAKVGLAEGVASRATFFSRSSTWVPLKR